MLTPFSSRLVNSVWLTLALFCAVTSHAQNWAGAEEHLAGKIASVTGSKAIVLEVSNRSSLSAAAADDIRRGLLTQLAVLGVRFVTAEQAAASVHVSLSEDLQSYVWIAEIRQAGNAPLLVMASLLRPAVASAESQAAAMVLRKVSLWSQPGPILDVAVLEGNPARMLVLDASTVTAYRLQDGRWQPDAVLPISHSRPWPRDLRGRLMLRRDHLFDVYLPGVYCRSSANSPPAMNCYDSDSDDAWPVGTDQFILNASFASSRNFFNGTWSPGVGKQTSAPVFYSAAPVPREAATWWLLAAVDGRVHLLDGFTDQVVEKTGWGSDIATLRSGCGSGWQVLATGSGSGQKDVVQAFEVASREPVAASTSLAVSGAITTLWTESGGAGAVAVVFNCETGGYEAFRLTLACGR